MRSVQEPPMRSEDDLRAALTDLERYAPDVDTVLGRVRERTAPRRGSGWLRILAPRGPRSLHWPRILPPRGPGSPRWPRLVAGVAVAAALAGLVIALVPGVLTAGHGPAPASRQAPTPPGMTQPGPTPVGSQYRLPSAASMGRAMLTAANAANDDILYTLQTGVNRGSVVDTYRDWSWPAQPVTGQPERTLNVFSQRVPTSGPLLLAETDAFNYIAPKGDPNYVKGHLTVVCYVTSFSKQGCGYGNTNTPAGTYSTWYGRFVNPNPGLEDLRPGALAKEITGGLWRVTRRAWYEGQPAVELAETPKGHYRPLPVVLWVNAHTYLPLRMLWGPGTPPSTVNWSFLKPTPGNMALLNARIPVGYRHSGGS